LFSTITHFKSKVNFSGWCLGVVEDVCEKKSVIPNSFRNLLERKAEEENKFCMTLWHNSKGFGCDKDDKRGKRSF